MDKGQVKGILKSVGIFILFILILTNLDTVRNIAIGLWEGTLDFLGYWLYLLMYETDLFVMFIMTIAITLCSIYFTIYRMWQKPIYLHSEIWKIDKLVGRVTWIKGSDTGILYAIWKGVRILGWAFTNLIILMIYPFRWMSWRAKGLAFSYRPRDPPKLKARSFKLRNPMDIPIGDSHYKDGLVIYFRRLGCFWRDVWPWRMPKIYYPKEREMEVSTWKATLEGYNLKFNNDKDPSKAHFKLESDTMTIYDHPLVKYEKGLKLVALESQLKVEKAIGSDSETAKEERRKFTVLSPREILKGRGDK